MFPPPQKTENTPYFQYPVHLCIRMHTNRCHVIVTTQPCPKPCVIFHTMLASKTELLYSCQHYAGESPLVSHMQMTTTYIYIQGVSRLVDITAGGNFLGLCDQKSSYKHVFDFGQLRSYGRLKLRIESKDY